MTHDQSANHAHSDSKIEIELKFLAPKAALSPVIALPGVRRQSLDQIYLSWDAVILQAKALALPAAAFEEWRVRRVDDGVLFTAKGKTSAGGAQRLEYETRIDESLYKTLIDAAEMEGPIQRVRKTRYSLNETYRDAGVEIDIDEYHETGSGAAEYDFLTCELEVERPEQAQALLDGAEDAPAFSFLRACRNVTGVQEFSNKRLAERGFPADSYQALMAWLDAK